MNRLLITIFLILTATFQISAQDAQGQSFDLKVRKMLELSGASENFNVAIKNMLNMQRASYEGFLSEDFFNELEKEIMEIGMEKLIPKFIPIYKKHLSEEDLDEIIVFYESEAGQKLTRKMPLIIDESMQIGAEWGEEIGLEIFNRVQNSNDVLFTKDLAIDCTKFRKGSFESRLEMVDDISFVERKDNIQIEKLNDIQIQLEIEWISNNKYLLKAGKDENNDAIEMEVTIYEVNDEGYKYILKHNGEFAKGSMKKLNRKL